MNDKAPEAAIRKGDHEASAIARASTSSSNSVVRQQSQTDYQQRPESAIIPNLRNNELI
jgi:hypothetical protein